MRLEGQSKIDSLPSTNVEEDLTQKPVVFGETNTSKPNQQILKSITKETMMERRKQVVCRFRSSKFRKSRAAARIQRKFGVETDFAHRYPTDFGQTDFGQTDFGQN